MLLSRFEEFLDCADCDGREKEWRFTPRFGLEVKLPRIELPLPVPVPAWKCQVGRQNGRDIL